MKDYKSKETMLVITVGFLVMYSLFHFKWMLTVAMIVGLAGVFSFYLSKKIDWLWGGLTRVLSFLSNTIILTLCFYLIITPVALIVGTKASIRSICLIDFFAKIFLS